MSSIPTETAALARCSKRATRLIEAMLKEMQRGIGDTARLESAEWVRIFGSKQSMVMNLQKLVQALASLPDPHKSESMMITAYREDAPLSAEEMSTFNAWLEQKKLTDSA